MISPIEPVTSAAIPVERASTNTVQGSDFLSWVGHGLSQVDASLRAADRQVLAMAAGESVSVHDVMIAMEQARLDLTLMAEVRNRLVETYQELIRMQL